MEQFIEVYLSTTVLVCETRDPKGLYKKARTGELQGFTGVSAPYEAPKTPAVSLDTGSLSVGQCLDTLSKHLEQYLV